MFWTDLKMWIEQVSGLDRDALHIYIALLIQLGMAVFFRKRLASIWPLLAVLAVELINEYFDYRQFWGAKGLPDRIHEELYKDIWNTMLAPTFLFLIASIWPGWLVPNADPDVPKNEEDILTEDSGN